MSLMRALADVALRTAFTGAANTNVHEIRDAKEADRYVFEQVDVRPNKRIATAFIGANKIAFVLVLLLLVILIPTYIIFNIITFAVDPIAAVVGLFFTFSPVVMMIAMFWVMGFLLSLVHNPHIKRTGLGVDYDYFLRLRMKSSILLTLDKVTGITSFKLSHVDCFEMDDSRTVIVHFAKSKQWWKRLISYTGLHLSFRTAEDAQKFYKIATDNLQNLEQKIETQRKMNIEERKRVHRILYGHDQL